MSRPESTGEDFPVVEDRETRNKGKHLEGEALSEAEEGDAPTSATTAAESFGKRGDNPGEEDSGGNRGMISRDLLDELSHEPDDDWNQGAATSAPGAGFETPSESCTPTGMRSPSHDQSYGHAGQLHHMRGPGGPNGVGFICMDQWDWKTDAPEFVPGGIVGFASQGAWAPSMDVVAPSGATCNSVDKTGSPHGKEAHLGQLRRDFEWQLRSKGEELSEMQTTVNQLEIEIAQVQTSWEMERRTLMRQISHYRAVLDRYCIPIEEAGPSSYEGQGDSYRYDPSAASQWGGEMAGASLGTGAMTPGQGMGFGVGAGYGRGPGKIDGAMPIGPFPGAVEGCAGLGDATGATSSLDSKMRQLNSLLQEGNGRQANLSEPSKERDSARRRSDGGAAVGAGGADGSGGESSGGAGNGAAAAVGAAPAKEGGDAGGAGSIASTLQAMFPHATVHANARGEPSEEDDEEARDVEAMLRGLEEQVGRQVDERALRSLHGLTVRDRAEALSKVAELVDSQGGHCRNLSSILQSVCRKIEKRCSKVSRAEQQARAAAPPAATRTPLSTVAEASPLAATPATKSQGGTGAMLVRQQSGGSDSATGSKLNTPAGRRSNRSWADMDSGDDDDEDDFREGLIATPIATPAATPSGGAATSKEGGAASSGSKSDEVEDHWTPLRIERAARRGYDMRQSKGGQWELKISMANIEPPLTKVGMERYCTWLRERLSDFREEHGAEPLHSCRGEIDFSHDKMTNEMLWMLLETLAQNEVHIALLKLFANEISQGGVLAICEFIRTNLRADAVQELHLSHNEIDDESALELLRTLNHRPRYPPRRPHDTTGEMVAAPVWLRLNHNWVRDPQAVCRAAEAEGVTICAATDRHVCGTSRCGARSLTGECPIVHLFSFKVQS